MKTAKLCPEEREKPYAKYFDIPVDPPYQYAQQIIDSCPMDPGDAQPVDRLAEAFADGNRKVEMGYCVMPDGSGYVTHYGHLPNATMEMLRWWFQWFNIRPQGIPEGHGNLRYKLWCPPDHWDHGFVNGSDPSDGTFISESLDLGAGDEPGYTVRTNIDPIEAGVPRETVDRLRACGAYFSLSNEKSEGDANRITAVLMRPHPSIGVEMKARIWWGYSVEGGKIIRDPRPCPEKVLRKLLIHNIAEVQHLALFLPQLWAEQREKPLWED